MVCVQLWVPALSCVYTQGMTLGLALLLTSGSDKYPVIGCLRSCCGAMNLSAWFGRTSYL